MTIPIETLGKKSWVANALALALPSSPIFFFLGNISESPWVIPITVF